MARVTFDLVQLGCGLLLLVIDILADVVDLGFHLLKTLHLVGRRAIWCGLSFLRLITDNLGQDLRLLYFMIVLLQKFLMVLMKLEEEFTWHLHSVVKFISLTLIG